MRNKKSNYIDYGVRGRLSIKNKLNELTGKEWIKFTKSWFIHNPPRRNSDELLHPAKYPESLVEEFILFFTKKDEWVFDPFLGTGSTLIAAGNANRNAVGIELQKEYIKISNRRVKPLSKKNHLIPLIGSSLKLKNILGKAGYGEKLFDFIITSPPYWNQLERNSIRQQNRKKMKLDTKYSNDDDDIGNVKSYDEFIEVQASVFDLVFDITKNFGYLVIITNNVFYNGILYPLAFDTAISLAKRGDKSWRLKDEKIWLQNDKKLLALGINNAWVGNRHHQYCLIFRKEL